MKKYLNLPKLFLLILVVLFSVSPCVYSKELSGRFIKLKSEKYNYIYADYTELKDGRLLISKGTTKFQIYNPKTNKFEKVTQPKYGHTFVKPVLLKDGRVFLPGYGKNYIESRSSLVIWKEPYEDCEFSYIYNPITDTYTKSSKMLDYSPINASVLLPDGRVFFVHGRPDRNSKSYTYAEIYNPKTDSFESAGESSINVEETIVRVGDEVYSKEEYEYNLYKEAKEKKAEEKKKRIAEMYKYAENDLRNKLNKKLYDDEEKPKEEPKQASVSEIKPVYEKRELQDNSKDAILLPNGEVLIVWNTYAVAEIYNPTKGDFRRIYWPKRKDYNPIPYYIGNGQYMFVWRDKKIVKIYNPVTEQIRQLDVPADNKVFASVAGSYNLSNSNVLFINYFSSHAILYDAESEKFIDMDVKLRDWADSSFLLLNNNQLLTYGGDFPTYSGGAPYRRKMKVFNIKTKKLKKIGYSPIFHVPMNFILLNTGNLLLETFECKTSDGPCYSVFYLYKVKSKKNR